MDGSFATRLPKDIGMKVRESTPFTLHSSFTHEKGAVIDYTENKILRMIKTESNMEILRTLMTVLKDYKTGAVAVGWHKGRPCVVPVTQEK